jgi:glycosyltransferase involved in cell wall biosynthesis
MSIYVIIPAYNESQYVAKTLTSLAKQTLLPDKVVVVNDNSTDNTAAIVQEFAEQYAWLTLINTQEKPIHLPGSKVIRAFQAGYDSLDKNYNIILKLDADIILPPHYLETIKNHFDTNPKAGMVGGFAYIESQGKWLLENLTDKDHIRGAFKAYRKACFETIGGLKPAMGWDTVDELLCRFYQWDIITDPSLVVKHLKPTGAVYDNQARYKQGEAFYSLGYGFWLTLIASLKLAYKKKKPLLFFDYLKGYKEANKNKKTMLVTPAQAAFVKKYRWQKIKQKINFKRY